MKIYSFKYEINKNNDLENWWKAWGREVACGVKKDVDSYVQWMKIYHPAYEKLTSESETESFKKDFTIGNNTERKILLPSELKYNQWYTTTTANEYLLTTNGENDFITKDAEGNITITDDTWYISNHLSSTYTYDLRTGDLSAIGIENGVQTDKLSPSPTNTYIGFQFKESDTSTTLDDLFNITNIAKLKYRILVSEDGKNYSSYVPLEYPTFKNLRLGTTILSKNQPTSIADRESNTSHFLKFYLADEDVYLPAKNSNGTYSIKKYKKGTRDYGLVCYLPLYLGNARWILKESIKVFNPKLGSWSVKSYSWDWSNSKVSTINIFNNGIAWTGEPIISEITTQNDGYIEDFITNTTIETKQSVIDNHNQWEYNINMKNENMREDISCFINIL